jgi:hypothetical protein
MRKPWRGAREQCLLLLGVVDSCVTRQARREYKFFQTGTAFHEPNKTLIVTVCQRPRRSCPRDNPSIARPGCARGQSFQVAAKNQPVPAELARKIDWNSAV